MDTKMVIVIRKDLNMRKGKVGAQCSHGAVGLVLDGLKLDRNYLTEDPVKQWIENSFRKIVVYVNSEQELDDIYNKALSHNLKAKMIVDSGDTEFHNIPTKTVVAIGPDYSDRIDSVTGDLPLY